MAFQDRFGAQAADYAAARPRYPHSLFDWLLAQSPGSARAWDCATGTGQAACALADYFGRVDATDASARQIAHAQPCPRVHYRVAPAEASGLEAGSVDLVTVAQALHWFDRAAFFTEAHRVLRPGGVLAVWSYGLFESVPEADAVIRRLYAETLEPDWDPARRLVEEGYAGVAFPGEAVAAPPFSLRARWTLERTARYLASWSAVQAYRARTGADPIPDVEAALAAVWPAGEALELRWPLALHVRRNLSGRGA